MISRHFWLSCQFELKFVTLCSTGKDLMYVYQPMLTLKIFFSLLVGRPPKEVVYYWIIVNILLMPSNCVGYLPNFKALSLLLFVIFNRPMLFPPCIKLLFATEKLLFLFRYLLISHLLNFYNISLKTYMTFPEVAKLT